MRLQLNIFTLILIIYALRNVSGGKLCLDSGDRKGVNYTGTLNKTNTGKYCQNWKLPTSSNDTYRSSYDYLDHNFCRNPDGKKFRPWCFTNDTENEWEYCDIKTCSDEKCGVQFTGLNFYSQSFEIKNNRIKKKARVKRVLGGDDAKRGSLPWVASLRQYDFSICAATLIGPRYVITAAHCLVGNPPAKYLTVTAGHTMVSDWKKDGGQGRQVAQYSKYVKYSDSNSGVHDIALIEVTKPFEIDGYTRPVCLPAQRQAIKPGTLCVAAGWGNTYESDYAGELKQVVLPIKSNRRCKFSHFVQLCAGYYGAPHGTCIGDSGGPLMCLHNGSWTLFGITSFATGRDCDAKSAWVGGYTRVSSYVNWIDRKISSWEKKKY